MKIELSYDPTPRRFRWPNPGGKHPTGREVPWAHGCYWPMTDLVATDMGIRGTGIPRWPGIEWIDGIDDLPWAEPARAAPPRPAEIVDMEIRSIVECWIEDKVTWHVFQSFSDGFHFADSAPEGERRKLNTIHEGWTFHPDSEGEGEGR